MIRRVLVLCFKIILSGLLIGFLLHRIGIQRFAEHLREIDGSWLTGALVLFLASHFLGSFQWWLLLRSEGIWISWGKTVSFYFVGLFFNNFLISNLGGDLFRMVDVRRYSKNGTGAVSTVFLDRFMGLFVLTGIALLVGPWIMVRGELRSYLRLPFLVLMGGWVLMCSFLFSRRFARPFAWLIRRTIPEGITNKAREVYRKISQFGLQKNLLFRIIGISFIVQSARVLTHYLVGRSLGITISPFYFFLIIPVVAVVASLPVSLGGIGIREQMGVLLFGAVGVTALQAFSVEFAAYLVAVVSSLPGMVVFVGRKKVEKCRREFLSKNITIGDEL